MARDPKPEHTREERKPPGLMLQGKMTLSVLFVIDPHLGPQSPVLCPAHGQVQQDGGSGPVREDSKVTVTKHLHVCSELSQEEAPERQGTVRGETLPSCEEDARKDQPSWRTGPGGAAAVCRGAGRGFVCWVES